LVRYGNIFFVAEVHLNSGGDLKTAGRTLRFVFYDNHRLALRLNTLRVTSAKQKHRDNDDKKKATTANIVKASGQYGRE
jgi:hypothetical protein